jgi:hypothetical protein
MEENLNGLRISSHDDELGNTTVQGLGGLVGALLELLVVGGLLDQVEDRDGQCRVGQRIGLRVGTSTSGGRLQNRK